MKKLLIFSLLISLCGMQAQTKAKKGKADVDSAAIPLDVKQSFKKENPDLEAVWKSEGNNYKAQYADNANVTHMRLYEKNGTLLWRDDEVSGYPQAISNYFNQKFPNLGYTIWARIDKEGQTTYYGYHDMETIWFDKNGKCINPKGNKEDKTINIK